MARLRNRYTACGVFTRSQDDWADRRCASIGGLPLPLIDDEVGGLRRLARRAALRGLPTRRRFFQDGDRAVADVEVTAGYQVFQQPADHVPRSADALGDVLLRKLLGHH